MLRERKNSYTILFLNKT